MHELYVASSIYRIVKEEAERNGARRIVSLTVEVGQLSGVVVEALEFAFPSVTAGGLAEGATIHVETIAGAGKCPACDAEFALDDYLAPCPSCDHVPVEVTAGKELRVKEIEVE